MERLPRMAVSASFINNEPKVKWAGMDVEQNEVCFRSAEQKHLVLWI